jgi:hypothetical protein
LIPSSGKVHSLLQSFQIGVGVHPPPSSTDSGGLSPGARCQGCDFNYISSSSVNIKKERNYTSRSHMPTFLAKDNLMLPVSIMLTNGPYTKLVHAPPTVSNLRDRQRHVTSYSLFMSFSIRCFGVFYDEGFLECDTASFSVLVADFRWKNIWRAS